MGQKIEKDLVKKRFARRVGEQRDGSGILKNFLFFFFKKKKKRELREQKGKENGVFWGVFCTIYRCLQCYWEVTGCGKT